MDETSWEFPYKGSAGGKRNKMEGRAMEGRIGGRNGECEGWGEERVVEGTVHSDQMVLETIRQGRLVQ